MSSDNTNNASKPKGSSTNNSNKRGIDAALQAHGRSLVTGGSIAFRLVKGPSGTVTADPVDGKAPRQAFPVVAKFPASVVRPDFGGDQKSARLYQQDVPKPAEDSDEEEVVEASGKPTRKRWKYADKDKPRQWVLQDQVDFLETMVARREQKPVDSHKVSTRYEGSPEHNPSHYVLFRMAPPDQQHRQKDAAESDGDRTAALTVQVMTLPLNCTATFAQPSSRKTLSLNQAEQAIQDQRMGIRTMHHVHTDAADAIAADPQQPAAPLRIPPAKNKNTSKNRLLGRLKAQSKKQAATDGGDDDEGDDVMGDVTFRNRKGGGTARKELLTSMGDADLAVSQEGVLGGSNDAAFGMGQRFGQLQNDKTKQGDGSNKDDDEDAAKGAGNNERGADGAAMADDFYQRDVQAEYEELDYDAQEQFDDDDVDMAEGEVNVDSGGGYGMDEEDDGFDDEALEEETVAGVEGLASVAGFKLMLAKARGDIPAQPVPEGGEAAANGAASIDKSRKDDAQGQPEKEGEKDHFAKIMEAAELARTKKEEEKNKPAAPPAAAAIQVDENGLRIITLNAVRREIWLNHRSTIPMKRLMKIFDIKKKASADRQNKFREVVKELCIMKTDPVAGRMLVLKQHYSNMSS